MQSLRATQTQTVQQAGFLPPAPKDLARLHPRWGLPVSLNKGPWMMITWWLCGLSAASGVILKVTVNIFSAGQNPEDVFVGLFCFACPNALITSIDLRENIMVLNPHRDLWARALGSVWLWLKDLTFRPDSERHAAKEACANPGLPFPK